MASTIAMSWDDYQRLDERWVEYIDGHAVMNPSPRLEHQLAAQRLTNVLQDALSGPAVVVQQWAWKPFADEFQPDVIVIPPTDENLRFTGTPYLCVEILSPSNRRHDLVVKAKKYAEAGLPRYWILDPREVSLTTHILDGPAYRVEARVVGDEEAELGFGAGIAHVKPSALFRQQWPDDRTD
jgi:Uma2 family endonuclease